MSSLRSVRRFGRISRQSLLGLAAVAAALPAFVSPLNGATIYWDGGSASSDNWTDTANWSTLLAGDGTGTADPYTSGPHDLVYYSTTSARRTTGIIDSSLTINSLSFLAAATNPVTVVGNGTSTVLTLNGGGMTINSGAGAVTLGSATPASNFSLNLGASQTWLNNGSTLTINANLTGSVGTVLTIRGTDPGTSMDSAPGTPNVRLAGNNSGYLGSIILRRASDASAQRSSLMLMNPGAMIGGNIDLTTSVQRLLVSLNGNGVSTAYTFGVGTGNNEISMGGSDTGINAVGGNVTWDPGNGSGYNWANVASNRIGFYANVSGDFSQITMGTTGQTLTLSGAAKTIAAAGSATISNIAFTLADDGTARNLTKSNNGTLVLQGGAATGNLAGTTTVSAGGLSVSNMNQIFNGNLNISGGVFVFNGINWANFTADRSSGNGTGANQWQLSGTSPGFAARGTDVTIDATQTTATTFDRDFTLGATARVSAASLYANAAVILNRGIGVDTITLSSATNRTITVVGGASLASSVYTLGGPIHEIAGIIGGGTAGRTLNIQASATTATNGLPMFRLSNSNNNFVANIVTPGSSPGGYGILIASDDAVFGNAANTVTINGSTPGSGLAGNTGWLVLFEGSKNFARALTFDAGTTDNTSAPWGLGAYSGTAVYSGTVTINNTNANANNTPLTIHAEANATFDLGIASGAAMTLNNNMATANRTLTLRKTGAGVAQLQNLSYGGSSTGTLRFNIQNGVLRETGSAATNSVQGRYLTLAGGVLETNNTLNGGTRFNRTLSTTVGASNLNWASGGFAAYGGDLLVDLNTAGTRDNLEFSATGGFAASGSTINLSSTTATGTVELFDNLSFRFSQQTFNVARGSATVDARLSGTLSAGNSGGGLIKTGAGILELTGAANTSQAWTTQVNAGTLLLNNTSGSATSTGGITVASGATLGGSGSTISATIVSGSIRPGNSIGQLNTGSVTWNGAASASAATDWVFELGASNTADLLNITGAFNKDTTNGSIFRFNFAGSTAQGTFKLVDWTTTSNFDINDFSYTNLGGGNNGVFSFNGSELILTVSNNAPITRSASFATSEVGTRRDDITDISENSNTNSGTQRVLYGIEVDGLNTDPDTAATGSVLVNPSPSTSGRIYVAMWLTETSAGKINDLITAMDTTYNIRGLSTGADGDITNAEWNYAQAALGNTGTFGNFNVLFAFDNITGPYFNWDFTNAGIGVDAVAVIPEPTSLALLGLGAIGLLTRRRTTRRN